MIARILNRLTPDLWGDRETETATLAAENATLRAEQARDDALVEALSACKQVAETARDYSIPQMVMGANKCHDDISDLRIHADAILALRDKPAPGLTPKIEVKFTWAKGDEEFWVHLKSPDGKSAGFNLGNPKGMIATALLRAIAGGGDE